jgi:hypothetical protein
MPLLLLLLPHPTAATAQLLTHWQLQVLLL